MRDILFRAKRLDNGEWVESGTLYRTKDENGDVLVFLGSGQHAVFLFDGKGNILSTTALEKCVYYRTDPSSVCQFTGMCDKNGVRIFEGDIVLRFGCCYEVHFENGQWVAVDKHGFWVELYDDVTYTVIGNIHDNKLEVDNE